MKKQFESGRISSSALRQLRGAVSADHINEGDVRPRRGSPFSNPTPDYGPAEPGNIDQKINARQYGYKLRGTKPAAPPQWSARWFDYPSRIKWDSGRGTPPAAEQEAGGLPDGANSVTGTSALDRARRGET
jgi:hypothetical protein